MFETIANWLSNKKNYSPFNQKYRSGYKNMWINNLRDYTP